MDHYVNESEAEERKRATEALLEAGEFVRTSAIGTDAGVRVTFRNGTGVYADAVISHDRYRAVPLLEPATPATFGLELAPTQAERDAFVRAEIAHWLEVAELEGIDISGEA